MKFKEISPSKRIEEHVRLKSLTFSDGSRIPAQRELADKYDVSRNAVKHALGRLQQEGIIRIQKRQGIKINKKLDVNLLGMSSMSNQLGDNEVKIKHLGSTKVTMSNEFINFFGNPNNKLIEIKRKRYLNGRPFSFEITFLDETKFEDILNINFNDKSLYQVLDEKYHKKPTYGYENISCILADEFLAKELDIEINKSVYQVDSFNYGDEDDPVEHTTQYISSENVKYHFRAKNILDYQEDE